MLPCWIRVLLLCILFSYKSLSLSLNIQYLTDGSVTKVLLVSSWVKLSNFECTFSYFKNSWFDGYMNKVWTCDFVINCKGLWAWRQWSWESLGGQTGNERSRWVTESSLLPLNHICAWHGGNALQEVRLKSSHTPAYTMSFFVCGACAPPAEVECFHMRHVGFSFFKVQRLQSRIWNNLTAVFGQQSQKFKYIIHQNWTL